MVPLALIDHETNGRSTPAAQTLLSALRGNGQLVAGHGGCGSDQRPDSFAPMDEGRSRAARNMALAASWEGAGHSYTGLVASGWHPAGADGRPGSRPGHYLPDQCAAVSSEEKPRRGALRWVGRKSVGMATAYPRIAWQTANPTAIQAEAANIRRLWTVLLARPDRRRQP